MRRVVVSRTVAEYNIGEVMGTDEEIAAFLDIAITVLHHRSIMRAGGGCDIDIEEAKENPLWLVSELKRIERSADEDRPVIDEMNRVLSELSDHPVDGWSLRFVQTTPRH
jgi:hypothetical protein